MYCKTIKVFYFYTTGLANWGCLDTVSDKWLNSGIYNNILRQIPKKYNNIQIIHYDPIIIMGGNKQLQNKLNIISEINTILELQMQQHADERVKSNIFIPEKFNLHEVQQPHIIIDFAHIFEYIKQKNTVRINNHYGEEVGPPLKLNSFYIGFIGEKQIDNGFSSYYLISAPLFNIKNGIITTYIDKMIELDYDYDPLYPINIIKKIYMIIQNKLIDEWRYKNNIVNEKFDNAINKINQNIIIGIIDSIMNDIKKEDVIEIQFTIALQELGL